MPEVRNVDGVPEYRGISFGITIWTCIASGGTASREAARAKSRTTATIPTWQRAEMISPWRLKRFVATINDRA